MSHPQTSLPELMSPAGDWDCACAAVENGADAVYFGLQNGFNARARAANFTRAELPDLMRFLRIRGVRGYLTLNTLVFDPELPEAEKIVREAAAVGVDAVLVQDLGLLRLIGRICPELPIHASTQMTLASAECIREVESLGVRRVVLPRELSIEQIAAVHRRTDVELEAFVHGALCISYSGQCLASLSMGGRSANRGQCAQPCRLPYEVLSEARTAAMRYPLSPHDLAAHDRLPQLIDAGVRALKIEGRMKSPEYVACVTRYYRNALDAVWNRRANAPTDATDDAAGDAADDFAVLETVFSRGFCRGWLDGPDHRALVSGVSSDKRGTCVGVVRAVRGNRVLIELTGRVQRGDGVMFQADGDRSEQGGRIYEIFHNRRSIEGEVTGGVVELAFRYGGIDGSQIRIGQKVWKTDDPKAGRRLRKTFSGAHSQRRMMLDLTVDAAVGRPLRIDAVTASGAHCLLESPEPLAEATKHPITQETLAQQFGRLGKTPFQLRRLDAKIEASPMIPLSVLGKLRRQLVEQLEVSASRPPARKLADADVLPILLEEDSRRLVRPPQSSMRRPNILHVLCRTVRQIEAALRCGVSSIIVDLLEHDRMADAVRTARSGGARVILASPRIHKPGESDVLQRMAESEPDGVLARHLAALQFFRPMQTPVIADFSLNAVNHLAIAWLLAQGAERITPAYDLDNRQLLDLCDRVPTERLEAVVHRHTPMFHSEYCLFCNVFSQGSDRTIDVCTMNEPRPTKGRPETKPKTVASGFILQANINKCGMPCRKHEIRLRDRRNAEHIVLADSQCRNTVFHAESRSLLPILGELQARGVCHYRVELLTEQNAAEVRSAIAPYLCLL